MALTRNHIQHTAERFRFTVQSFEPGPGTRADIVHRCERTEQLVTIGIYPCSSENDLARLFAMSQK
jgi:hypothetical protein